MQYCAAVLHAAVNLDVSFTRLKAKVAAGQRLEAAIHDLKPGVDAKSQAARAAQQAADDLTPSQG